MQKNLSTATRSWQLPIRRIVLLITIFCAALAVIGGASQILIFWKPHWPAVDSLHDIFWVDGDADVWTWASSMAFFVCAVLLAAHWAVSSAAGQRTRQWYWLGLAVVFLAFSIDDVATIHERSERGLQWVPDTGVFYFRWTLLAIPFAIVMGLIYLRFLLSLPGWVRNQFIIAAAFCIGGAVGLEMINSSIAYRLGDGPAYRGVTWLEECVELAGVIVFINALLHYLAAQQAAITMKLDRAAISLSVAASKALELRTEPASHPASVHAQLKPQPPSSPATSGAS